MRSGPRIVSAASALITRLMLISRCTCSCLTLALRLGSRRAPPGSTRQRPPSPRRILGDVAALYHSRRAIHHALVLDHDRLLANDLGGVHDLGLRIALDQLFDERAVGMSAQPILCVELIAIDAAHVRLAARLARPMMSKAAAVRRHTAPADRSCTTALIRMLHAAAANRRVILANINCRGSLERAEITGQVGGSGRRRSGDRHRCQS